MRRPGDHTRVARRAARSATGAAGQTKAAAVSRCTRAGQWREGWSPRDGADQLRGSHVTRANGTPRMFTNTRAVQFRGRVSFRAFELSACAVAGFARGTSASARSTLDPLVCARGLYFY